MLVNHIGLTLTKEDLQNVVDLMEPYGQISNGIELLNPPLDTFSRIIPKWVRKTKIVKGISKMLVNHIGLTLTKEDLQNVVDLMEPYGQISNGIELLNPPLDV
ncbi:unnamed protein product [Ilex paraguariensis]|uniref:Uncharacterized protein n=1 Tax=Ilex paraguariensis TaxID=185542 RepID=A0ABC8SMW9_9AQUA